MSNQHEDGDRRLLDALRHGSGDDSVAAAGIDQEALLESVLGVWRVLQQAPDRGTATLEQYLNWAADRALEWFDEGREREAGELFRYLVRHHAELNLVYNDPRLLGDSIASTKRGRAAFEAHMRGLLNV